MDYADGGDLHQRIQRTRQAGKVFSEERIVRQNRTCTFHACDRSVHVVSHFVHLSCKSCLAGGSQKQRWLSSTCMTLCRYNVFLWCFICFSHLAMLAAKRLEVSGQACLAQGLKEPEPLLDGTGGNGWQTSFIADVGCT